MTPLRSAYLDDPLTFARYLRQRPVLMLNARWDEFVPRGATLDLWAASGQPPIAWYPATHTSIWAFYPLISRRITGFLRSNFANKG
ncbi:MAG: hypothetical protein Q8O05_06335 [Chloroflexota bacterium]|nr:hypothetical protein [Chloroflexota bacterium]